MEGAAYQLSYAYVTKQIVSTFTTAKSAKACWARAAFNDDQEQLCFGMMQIHLLRQGIQCCVDLHVFFCHYK